MNKKKLVLGCLCLGLCAWGEAQNTARYDEPEQGFYDAVRLYENAKYGAAKRAFGVVQRRIDPVENTYFASEAMYYRAMCDVLLFHKNGASALRDFVEAYPNSNRVNTAYLQLANFEYDYKRYTSAYNYFKMVDPVEASLKGEEADRYYFRSGYAAFVQKKYAEAKLAFARLKDHENRYQVVATYYYAYILYTEGMYMNALEAFNMIADDPTFSAIVPLFQLQCHHALGDSRKVLETGPELMENARNPQRAAEIGRLLGEAYYKEGRYPEALPYMVSFFKNSSVVPDAAGRFILGYCYYKNHYYDSAAYHFQGVLPLNPDDALRQTALYHLAYCYAMQGNKKFAMNAFADVAKIRGQNEVMREDAMYHQAQLAYELGLTPYHESVKVLEDFLEAYPQSPYNKRIYSYLVSIYMTTKNYDMALASLEKIPQHTPQLKEAEQRLLFNKGVESFKRKAYGTALSFFERCVANGYDEVLTARACFWQGECQFVAGNYATAQKAYDRFVKASGAQGQPEYAQALYNLGYTAMEMVNYPLAIRYFEDFLKRPATLDDAALVADAYGRLGDCRYMQEEYEAAVNAYTSALQQGYKPADYAYLQIALCQGARGLYASKAEYLQKMTEQFSQSPYMPRVYSELASTCMMLNDADKALLYYGRLRDRYPRSPQALSAWSKMGLIYFNRGGNEEALRCFKHVAERNPSTEEGRQALVSIRNIYMSMNQIDKFFAYVNKLPNIKINEAEQDSLTYMAAENFLLEEDYVQAFNAFKKYTDTYPEGLFAVEAWRNAALCAERNNDRENLKAAYTKISQLPVPDAEEATRKLADMCYADKEYKPALGYYRKLKETATRQAQTVAAKVGEMRCLRILGMGKDAVESALEVIRQYGVSEQEIEEARYLIAQTAPAIGENELAMQQYEVLAKSQNTDYSSLARYALLEQRVKAGLYDEAERMIFDYISQSSMNEYYLVKTYLLWADIYYQKGNILQAKQTLQSIIDNYEGDDLKDLASQKMEMILQRESAGLESEQEFRSSRYEEPEEIVLPAM
ncbi:MAG: tetratricopeptide repeat protein [Bacteroides sp.]|nr:tetratricopeptide repeat protein [Ruminococcus flavefaciens]MCM1555358.1 tetratricopeptide repeat protein [Bacteroides sp.]